MMLRPLVRDLFEFFHRASTNLSDPTKLSDGELLRAHLEIFKGDPTTSAMLRCSDIEGSLAAQMIIADFLAERYEDKDVAASSSQHKPSQPLALLHNPETLGQLTIAQTAEKTTGEQIAELEAEACATYERLLVLWDRRVAESRFLLAGQVLAKYRKEVTDGQ